MRLDQLLVQRGLFDSRERARRAVMAGAVEVEGRRVDKPGTAVPEDARLSVLTPREPFVSRAGRKLADALDHYQVDPAGLVCLDCGASTGGFTDCLLQRGAVRVYAVDVGYGQLDHKLRYDPRVEVMERVNARHLQPGDIPEPCGLITLDVSFISLLKVVPALLPFLAPGGLLLPMIKPQFEAGRGAVGKGGILRDEEMRRTVVNADRRGPGGARAGAAGGARLGGPRHRRQPRGLRAAAQARAAPAGAGGVSPRAKAPAKKPAKSRAPRQPGLRRVGIVSKAMSREAVHTAGELAEWLRRRDVEAALDEATLRALGKTGSEPPFCLDDPCDLVVALGGDGTLLSVARSLAGRVPILGVNLGNLGFLTEINRGELYPSLVRVLAGRYSIEERSLYDVELRRHGGETHAFQVFNDAVIAKSALSRIVELSLRVDGHLVARFRADGLIISTPTGSTAYNLSAGGPILHPLLPVAVLTPICPHALSLRPMVVSDASRIAVTLETPSEEVYLTLDGQEGEKVGFRDTVAVTRGAASVRLVKVAERTYYDNLRGKLRWGGLQGREDSGEEPA